MTGLKSLFSLITIIFIGLRQTSLSLAENYFYSGTKSQDVILSDDKSGRRIDTTRQRSPKLTFQNTQNIHSQNLREPSSLFMRASDPERQSFAYFSSAAARKVRRHQAKLRCTAHD